MQTTVSLKNIEFYSFHGYYPEEKKAGNRFVVNLNVSFPQEKDFFVNYEQLFSIVKKIMMDHEPIDFIETMIEKVIELTKDKYDFVDAIHCEITKIKPPIAHFNGEGTSVQMTWKK
jgi:dihydroneopterin aldolase